MGRQNGKVCRNTFQLTNETSVPVFYRGNKIWARIWVRMNSIISAQE